MAEKTKVVVRYLPVEGGREMIESLLEPYTKDVDYFDLVVFQSAPAV